MPSYYQKSLHHLKKLSIFEIASISHRMKYVLSVFSIYDRNSKIFNCSPFFVQYILG